MIRDMPKSQQQNEARMHHLKTPAGMRRGIIPGIFKLRHK